VAKYRLTPAAERDLEDIWTYTAKRWSIDQAEKYIGGLIDTIEVLGADPLRSREADDVRPGYRRQNAGSHVIFFKLKPGHIEIVRILHQRMDFDEHFD
jgi:toxin ParE1/3/4